MRKIMHGFGSLLFIAFVVMASMSTAAEKGASGHEWSYEGNHGPGHWGDVKSDYAMCKTGKNQSPIDITSAVKADLPPIQFSYLPSQLRIINNGHSIQVNYAEGSFITVGGKQFQLVQFHFHHPSEEMIKGKKFDMVAHLVHKSADGNLAVVAVLIKKGQANAFIENLWTHLPKEEGMEEVPANVTIDASGLLPAQRGYYTYPGSLTTPPCTEGVTWYVLKEPIELSSAQINRFAHYYKHNARPVQPLDNRVVSESR
ncbi:MAG TPA: carbonic anhydrase [Nitrospirota bacterium]|nr:carbonic anhydrase [Nitrospirota bacterium]